jgi:hypothetical protein
MDSHFIAGFCTCLGLFVAVGLAFFAWAVGSAIEGGGDCEPYDDQPEAYS